MIQVAQLEVAMNGKNARLLRSGLAAVVLLFMFAMPALAAAPYYEGKTIEAIIPFPVAGGTDIWIRTIAPYLEKNIPGNPKFSFRNVGGGRGIPGILPSSTSCVTRSSSVRGWRL